MAGLLSSLARQGAEAIKEGARGQRRGRLRTAAEKSLSLRVSLSGLVDRLLSR